MAAQRRSLTRPFSLNSARTVAAAVASSATGPQTNPAQPAACRSGVRKVAKSGVLTFGYQVTGSY